MANSWLGIDYGSKRVGLALGSEEGRLATPYKTILNQRLITQLQQIATSEEIVGFVLGLPRNLEGEDTPQTEVVRRFAAELGRLGRPVRLQDEAGTTHTGKKDVDAIAAAQILQDYLDSL